MEIPYSVDDLCQITVDLLERNGFAEDVYIRPLAYKSEEAVANLKLHTLASDFTLMILPSAATSRQKAQLSAKPHHGDAPTTP